VRLEQTSRLRRVVPVPEQHFTGAVRSRRLEFAVSAHPGRTFSGVVSRIAGALVPKTRTMAVELDVENRDGTLAPGMFPDVTWPVVAATGAVLVPPTAVVTTTERTFVIRVTASQAEWVTVKKGASRGELVEVIGALSVGDVILRRGSDEVHEGSAVTVKPGS
jgi:RND family efflux transporter MFP subunit